MHNAPVSGDVVSCLAARLVQDVDLDPARSLNGPRAIDVRRAWTSALSSVTVNASDDPIPVPEGTSATEAISSGLPRQRRLSVSRRIGCRISSIDIASSLSSFVIDSPGCQERSLPVRKA
jgi:hypothetical protein